MKTFGSVEEILDFAIVNEEDARDFYLKMAQKAAEGHMADMFNNLARQEKSHRDRLLRVKSGSGSLPKDSVVADMKIADYLVAVVEGPQMSYQDALILAMKREKAAFKLYTNLAARVGEELQKLFESLAQEEARHKLHLELEYDEHVLTED